MPFHPKHTKKKGFLKDEDAELNFMPYGYVEGHEVDPSGEIDPSIHFRADSATRECPSCEKRMPLLYPRQYCKKCELKGNTGRNE